MVSYMLKLQWSKVSGWHCHSNVPLKASGNFVHFVHILQQLLLCKHSLVERWIAASRIFLLVFWFLLQLSLCTEPSKNEPKSKIYCIHPEWNKAWAFISLWVMIAKYDNGLLTVDVSPPSVDNNFKEISYVSKAYAHNLSPKCFTSCIL